MTNKKKNIVMGWVDVDSMIVDAAYQRERKQADVERIVDNYDERQFRPLDVSDREDGTYAVVDGQARYLAAQQRGESRLQCRIHRGLNIEEEAALFLALDEGVTVIQAYDRFRAGVKAERPLQVEVFGIIDGAGFKVTKHQMKFSIAATSACEAVHKKFGNLSRTLRVLGEWEGGDPKSLKGHFIRSVGTFLHLHPAADDARVIDGLRRVTPNELTRTTNRIKMDMGGSRYDCGARAIRVLYNKVKRGGKLRAA